jgi:hypothetical protein
MMKETETNGDFFQSSIEEFIMLKTLKESIFFIKIHWAMGQNRRSFSLNDQQNRGISSRSVNFIAIAPSHLRIPSWSDSLTHPDEPRLFLFVERRLIGSPIAGRCVLYRCKLIKKSGY